MTDLAGTVGVVLNPMAGRDIRRVVAQASLVSAAEKLMALRRVLAGMGAVAGTRALLVDDAIGYGKLVAQEARAEVAVELVPGQEGDAQGGAVTTAWVRALAASGADLVVVMGGDGTQKHAVEAQAGVPLLPIAGGTNNASCWTGDQTAAGMAAALVAAGAVEWRAVSRPAKLLHVRAETGREAIAVVDVALIRQPSTGALAVWSASQVAALAVSLADPTRPGLSNIAGMVEPVGKADDHGVWMEFDPAGEPVAAILAPGLLDRIRVSRRGRLEPGQGWAMPPAAERVTVALDGERSLTLAPGESVSVTLRRDGPPFVDPAQVFRQRARLAVGSGSDEAADGRRFPGF